MNRRYAFVVLAVPLVWTGCNAILGNDDGVYVDADASAPDAASTKDADTDAATIADARADADAMADAAVDGTPLGADAMVDAGVDAIADAACDGSYATDPANCGRCGHSCGGAGCTSGICNPIVFATGLNEPSAIAADSTGVYFTTVGRTGGANVYAKETVYACPSAGCGAAPTPLATAQHNPVAIALDATNVYWSNEDNGIVASCNKGGCGGVPSTVTSQAGFLPTSIAIGNGKVYWTDGVGNVVLSCAVTGCANPTQVATLGNIQPLAIGFFNNTVFWVNKGPTAGPGSVMSCASAGCGSSPTTLVPSTSGPLAIAVDATGVYWSSTSASAGAGTVARVGLGGGSVSAVLGGQFYPASVVIDGTFAYAVDNATGTVWRAPKDGSGPGVQIATGQKNPTAVAVDTNWVYWTNAGTVGNTDGSVARVAK